MGKITRCFGSKYKYKFAYITHTNNTDEIISYYPLLKLLPDRFFSKIWPIVPPFFTKIVDQNNSKTLGFMIHIPFIGCDINDSSIRNRCVKKIVKTIFKAKRLGCKAFTLDQKGFRTNK